jgi:hypothetical protein
VQEKVFGASLIPYNLTEGCSYTHDQIHTAGYGYLRAPWSI